MNHKRIWAPAIVRGWRWRIISGAPLPFTHVLPVAEAVRDMATETHFMLAGSRRLPNCLHGGRSAHANQANQAAAGRTERPTGKQQQEARRHARWLPEDEDGDGLIDHILVHAACGLTPAAIRILAHCHRLVVPEIGTVEFVPSWMGEAMPGGLYAPAREWLSRSPLDSRPPPGGTR